MSNRSQTTPRLFRPIEGLLQVYGERVRIARTRRRWSQAELAQRIGVTRQTIMRVERGDPVIGCGVLLTIFQLLGRQEDLQNLLDPMRDEVGLREELRRTPRLKRRKKIQASDLHPDPDDL